jgi:hypothetical protein
MCGAINPFSLKSCSFVTRPMTVSWSKHVTCPVRVSVDGVCCPVSDSDRLVTARQSTCH